MDQDGSKSPRGQSPRKSPRGPAKSKAAADPYPDWQKEKADAEALEASRAEVVREHMVKYSDMPDWVTCPTAMPGKPRDWDGCQAACKAVFTAKNINKPQYLGGDYVEYGHGSYTPFGLVAQLGGPDEVLNDPDASYEAMMALHEAG